MTSSWLGVQDTTNQFFFFFFSSSSPSSSSSSLPSTLSPSPYPLCIQNRSKTIVIFTIDSITKPLSFSLQHLFNILKIPGIKPSEVVQPSSNHKSKPAIMSFIDPSLLSLPPASTTAAPAQIPRRSLRRTMPIVIRDHTVLPTIEPRPQGGPHSGSRCGAAGLQDHRIMKKPRKPRTKSAKTARKSAVRKAQDASHDTESDGDSGSIVASNDGVRRKDGSLQWWDDQENQWSMMLSYVTTLRYRH